jgi:hypothetical protein
MNLQGVMHQVPGHDGVLPAAADMHAAMAGRMARRGLDGDTVVELEIVIHQQCLAGLDDRLAVEAVDIATAAGTLLSSPRIRAPTRTHCPSA